MTEPSTRLSLWGIELFLTTAEEGAVSAAARRLGVSVSAVSQQLTVLEATLGVILIDRSTRPVRLTAAGRTFLPRARRLLAELNQARSELAVPDLSALDVLRLGLPAELDADIVPVLLARLAARHEQCRFRTETGASPRLLEMLEARQLDMVVAHDPVAHEPWMDVQPLIQEPFVLVVPQGSYDSGAAGRTELPHLPMVCHSGAYPSGQMLSDYLRRLGTMDEPRFMLDSDLAVLSMVARGAGWAILSPLALRHARRFLPKVEIHPLPAGRLMRRISLVGRAGTLHDLPAQVCSTLRPLLQEQIIAPALAEFPWMRDMLKLL